jgi:hypothetical protein
VSDIMPPYDVTGLINKTISKGGGVSRGGNADRRVHRASTRQAQVADCSAGQTEAVCAVETSGCD